MMNYYKLNGLIYAYDTEQVAMGLADDKVAMTAEEVEAHLNPPKTQEQLDAEAKASKQLALDSITVTTTSGKVFDGRDIDQQRMVSAIMSADVVGLTETQWKLADNIIATVGMAELKQALALSIQAVGAIIVGGV
jgi:hypothetical protein